MKKTIALSLGLAISTLMAGSALAADKLDASAQMGHARAVCWLLCG